MQLQKVNQSKFVSCYPCPYYGQLKIWKKFAQFNSMVSSGAKYSDVSLKTIQNVITNEELLRTVKICKINLRCHLKVERKYEDVGEAT